nr:radical SAM protein [Lachnospiraceae bacterium]
MWADAPETCTSSPVREAVPEACRLCPRACGAPRTEEKAAGFCRSPLKPRLARAAAHFGEEPCISGTRGSGTLFFTGCHLACVFCQNHEISRCEVPGQAVSDDELRRIIDRLLEQGVHNLNFVSASHFIPAVARVLKAVRPPVPVVWNSSGYETVGQLRQLEGLVQVYLPDFKYGDEALGRRLSGVADYPAVALAALQEMLRQRGPYQMDADGLLQSGVMVRHLVLPGFIDNTLDVLDLLREHFAPGTLLLSLLNQYTPIAVLADSGQLDEYPSLKRRLTPEEWQRVWDYLRYSDWEDGYVQDLSSATEEMIPAFDGTGLA